MRKHFFIASFILIAAVNLLSCSTNKSATETNAAEPQYEMAAYVYSGETRMPDPSTVTTINYAFANMNDDRTGLVIENEPRFRQIVALKEVKPSLKVVLCIGGPSASLSEMAADSLKRAALAGDCRRIIDQYGIDGIDFDWEFPGYRGGQPMDSVNFTYVLRAVRDSIGSDKILSLAGGGDLPGVEVENVLDVLDYFNVMAYDLCPIPSHHTSLYRSELTSWRSVEEVVADYLSRGIPYDKMLLGLGFYGRGDGKYYKQWVAYYECKPYGDLVEHWDSVACVPYIADPEGNYAVSFDNPRSIEIKCDYIKEKGFRGGMCWRTELDDDSLSLAHTAARCLNIK